MEVKVKIQFQSSYKIGGKLIFCGKSQNQLDNIVQENLVRLDLKDESGKLVKTYKIGRWFCKARFWIVNATNAEHIVNLRLTNHERADFRTSFNPSCKLHS